MNVIEELWTAFSDIYFEPISHKYTDSLGTNYTSVTTFIHQFKDDVFDSRAKAEECVKKPKYKGETVESLMAKWQLAGDYACTLGTEIHSVMENLWQCKDYNGNRELMSKFEGMCKDFDERKVYCLELYKKLKKFYIPIKNEFIVNDVDNGLCGTIDFLAYNKVKKCYSILDWKTSKEFNTYDQYNNGKLLAPFSQFDACNVNEYSIQLSTYAWILEKHTSLRIGEMVLFQIPKKSTAPSIAVCNDMRPYLNKILK